jgi:hypothetical protein
MLKMPDLVGQMQLSPKGCYDFHDSGDMLLRCGCSCLWPKKKTKGMSAALLNHGFGGWINHHPFREQKKGVIY